MTHLTDFIGNTHTSDMKRSMTRRASDRGREVVKRVRNHDEAYMEVSKFCVWKCTCSVGNSSCVKDIFMMSSKKISCTSTHTHTHLSLIHI